MKLYRIYPSLLDAYQHYLNSEIDAEAFANIDSEGNYRKTADEIADERLRSLLDKINRVPFHSEAMERGTAFNALIDRLIADEAVVTDGKICKIESEGKEWCFDAALCGKTAQYLAGSISQLYQERELETAAGNVLLYGYIDYLLRDKVIDLKTTAKYQFGKYEQRWQRYVYPYILADTMQVSSFIYLACQMQTTKEGVSFGTLYPEEYTLTPTDTQTLRAFVDRFIEFIEQHRSEITDTKIFGL